MPRRRRRRGVLSALRSLVGLGLWAVSGEAALAYAGILIARRLNPRPYILTHLLAVGSMAHGLATLVVAARVVKASTGRDVRWLFRTLGLCFSAVVGYAYYVEPRRIETPTVEVVLRGLPRRLDGLRAALISDLHAGPHFGPREMERVVSMSNALNPDVVALLGDFVARYPADITTVTDRVGDLVAPLGIFAVLGNHDYWVNVSLVEAALRNAGVRLLKNSGVHFKRADARLWLAGLDDARWGQPDLAAALKGAGEGEVIVLLAHNPILARAAAGWGVPLVLSGHTHGGQIRLPGLGPLILPIHDRTLAYGFIRLGSTQLYVNRGVGSGTPPVRLGARPEITVLILRSGEGLSAKPGS